VTEKKPNPKKKFLVRICCDQEKAKPEKKFLVRICYEDKEKAKPEKRKSLWSEWVDDVAKRQITKKKTFLVLESIGRKRPSQKKKRFDRPSKSTARESTKPLKKTQRTVSDEHLPSESNRNQPEPTGANRNQRESQKERFLCALRRTAWPSSGLRSLDRKDQQQLGRLNQPRQEKVMPQAETNRCK